jgi:hypothetical protein
MIGPELFLVAVIGSVALSLRYATKLNKLHTAALRSAAQQLGLEFTPGTWRKSPVLKGRVAGQMAHIDHYTVSSGKSSVTYLRFRVLGADLPGDLTIKREGALSSMKKMILGEDILIGDPDFDQKFLLECSDEAELLGRLSVDARNAVEMAVDRYPATVSKGVIELLTTAQRTWRSADEIVGITQMLVHLTNKLCPPGPTVARLAKNATSDPIAGVRKRNFRLLVDLYPSTADARDAALKLKEDPESEIRIEALTWLRERAPLELLRENREAAPVAVARALALHDPGGPAEELLLEILEAGPDDARLAAAKVLERIGTVRAVEALKERASAVLGGGLAKAAKEAVEAIQGRVEGAEHGQLSLSAPVGGELSVEAAGGELSPADRSKG